MIGNIANRPGLVVTPQQMKELQSQATHRIGLERHLQIAVMQDCELYQFGQIRAGNLAIDYSLTKPHLAVTQHPAHSIHGVKFYITRWTGRAAHIGLHTAIGPGDANFTTLSPCDNRRQNILFPVIKKASHTHASNNPLLARPRFGPCRGRLWPTIERYLLYP